MIPAEAVEKAKPTSASAVVNIRRRGKPNAKKNSFKVHRIAFARGFLHSLGPRRTYGYCRLPWCGNTRPASRRFAFLTASCGLAPATDAPRLGQKL